jgi:aryl-alcohol dehydrogenase-like predicted oxidoreductase
MQETRLGWIRAPVSGIGVGTWGHGGAWSSGGSPVGWSGHDDRQAIEALLAAHASGLNHWDTADVYGLGHAESLIGSLWDQVPRASVFLATKVGWVRGDHEHPYDPRQIRTQLEGSLRRLATDHVDLLYLHRCDFGPEDRYLEGAVTTLRRAREEGKLRFLGLSDWNTRRIMRYVERVDPDVVQLHRTVLDEEYQDSGLAAWVADHDRGAVFFSPLLHGLLLGRDREPRAFGTGDHRQEMPAFRDPQLLAGLRRCREAVEQRFSGHPAPVLHALIGALLADAAGACVLLGLRTAEQARQASRVGEPLAPADAAWVRNLYRAVAPAASLASPWQLRSREEEEEAR